MLYPVLLFQRKQPPHFIRSIHFGLAYAHPLCLHGHLRAFSREPPTMLLVVVPKRNLKRTTALDLINYVRNGAQPYGRPV